MSPFNDSSSHVAQDIFNPALPPFLTPPCNSPQVHMFNVSTLKNVNGDGYNANNLPNNNNNFNNNAIMPMTQLGNDIRPTTNVSIMP